MRGRAKIGLALSGGGMRGLAHLGVLRALEEARIPVDMIAGTSMGGIIAGVYAAGVPLETAIECSHKMGLMDFASRERGRRGLFGQAKVRKLLSGLLGSDDVRFEDLRVPTAVVAADVESGQMVVLDKGPLIPALLATCAFPLVFSPVRYQDRWLVDGGVVNNYPVDIVRRMGADRVLGVLTPSRITLPTEDAEKPDRLGMRALFRFSNRSADWRLPFLIAQTSVGLTAGLVNRIRLAYSPPDVHLEVCFPNVGAFAAGRHGEIIQTGYKVATSHLPELVALGARPLPPRWLRTVTSVGRRLRRGWDAARKPEYLLYPE